MQTWASLELRELGLRMYIQRLRLLVDWSKKVSMGCGYVSIDLKGVRCFLEKGVPAKGTAMREAQRTHST